MVRRYLIDENTTPALADQLRRRQPAIEVVSVRQGVDSPKGTLDPDILLWVEAHRFTLITRNRKSMPEHLRDHLKSGHHIPGILILRPKASFGYDRLDFVFDIPDPSIAQAMLSDWSNGIFPNSPTIEIVTDSLLSGSGGAYAAQTGTITIYLAESAVQDLRWSPKTGQVAKL